MATDRDLMVHIDGAIKQLTLEAWRSNGGRAWRPFEGFTLAEELDRVDSAIGPKGTSMFAKIADDIRAAYTELMAARAILKERGL